MSNSPYLYIYEFFSICIPYVYIRTRLSKHMLVCLLLTDTFVAVICVEMKMNKCRTLFNYDEREHWIESPKINILRI